MVDTNWTKEDIGLCMVAPSDGEQGTGFVHPYKSLKMMKFILYNLGT